MHPAAQPIHQDEPHRHHRLILVRPGDAIGKRSWPGPPETRPLSAKGRKHVTRLARFLAGREVDVTTIVSGPESRDRETADVLSLWLERPAVVDPRVVPGLSPAGLEAIEDELTTRDLRPPHRQRMLLVAHEPVASMLLIVLTDSPGVDLAAGGAASLRIHGPIGPGCASVGWLVVPSMLRGLRTKRSKHRSSARADERELASTLA